jgi:hypothetical protein
MDIYLDDLKKEAQKRVLKNMKLKNDKEGNLDTFPLFVLDEQIEEEKEGYEKDEINEVERRNLVKLK